MKLKNFVLVVEEIERSLRFYSELFGLVKVREFDGNVILSGGLVLQERKIWEEAIGKEVSYRGHDSILYFETPSIAAFMNKVWASAWAVDLVHPMGEDGSDRHVLRVYDPDGHIIEIEEKQNAAENELFDEIEEEDYEDDYEDDDEDFFVTELNIGDVFTFGRYWQDANLAYGKAGISWRVLNKEDGNLLLLSNFALDARAYHGGEEAVTWEECDLRAWLNGSFMDSAFRWDERRLIEWRDGKDSERVFLLSEEELEEYWLVMDSNANTAGRYGSDTLATDYALERGAEGDPMYEVATWWWLRDAFGATKEAPYVDWTGQNAGTKPNETVGAVRPAMWVKEEVLEKATDIRIYIEDVEDEWED